MTSTETISLLNDSNEGVDNSTIKLILDKLMKVYSLKEIVETIIAEATKSEEEKESNEKNKFNDLIGSMWKRVGSIKMLKYILGEKIEPVEYIEQKKEQAKELKEKQKKGQKKGYKAESISSTVEDEVIELKNDDDDDINEIRVVDNNIIKVDEDDEEQFVTISLKDSDNNIDNKIIPIYDNEQKCNYSRVGFNSELKRKRKRDTKTYSVQKYRIYSVEKCVRKNKDFINEKKKKLDYHCSLINNIYFKYRLKPNFHKGNKSIANFVCCNPKCPGCGIYNLKNKMFTLLRGHDIKDNYSSCINMDDKDKVYYSYMIDHGIVELQITNE